MKIQETKDGSHTLVSDKFGELYHSHNGSMQEAKHIFIENGLKKCENDICVFEMGFGSGLNAILSYYYAKENSIKINYTTIEAFPVDIETAEKLNYNDFIKENDYNDIFGKIHKSSWEKENIISNYFTLHKIKDKIENLDIEIIKKVDIIFYDAFAPNSQANLWETEVLTKMYKLLKPNGFLITYCAKGEFKRTLKNIGFKLVSLPGPIGKREITKALKIVSIPLKCQLC